MTDAFVYCCDSTDCYWNHDCHCSCSQIEVNKTHTCVAYILKELAEQAILANIGAEKFNYSDMLSKSMIKKLDVPD